jgi:hypothetical protein
MNLRKVSFGIIKRIGETTPPMLLFGAATLLLILGLLGLAEDGSESPRCDFGNIDCLIASHETLAAGLLGAAGTVFAIKARSELFGSVRGKLPANTFWCFSRWLCCRSAAVSRPSLRLS